jgi:hypothetical protein
MQGFNQGFSQGSNQGFNKNEVPSHFTPLGNTYYSVVSILDNSKALTIINNILMLTNYKGDSSQRFTILPQGNKYAFLVQSTKTGLCVFYNKHDSGIELVADPNQQPSSWFGIEKVSQGENANRGYVITTFCGKCLDIEGGDATNGKRVIQYDRHNGNNQVWLILAADQEQGFNQNQGWGNQQQGFNQNQGWGNQGQGFSPNQGFNQGFNQGQNS